MKNVSTAAEWPKAMLQQVQSVARQDNVTAEDHGDLARLFFGLDDVAGSPAEATEALQKFLDSRELASTLAKARRTGAEQLEGNARSGLCDALDGLMGAAHRRLATAKLDQRFDSRLATKKELSARRAELMGLVDSPDGQVLLEYIRLSTNDLKYSGLDISPDRSRSLFLTGAGKMKVALACWLQVNAEQMRGVSVDGVRQTMARLVQRIAQGDPWIDVHRFGG